MTILVIPTSDFSVICNFKSLNCEPEQSKSASPQWWSGDLESEMEHNRRLWDVTSQLSLLPNRQSWVFCCHQLFYQIRVYVTNTEPRKVFSFHCKISEMEWIGGTCHHALMFSPLRFSSYCRLWYGLFPVILCLWSTHETRSEGSREWGNTFAACDVGIAHCLFEAIWSRHMWENLVLVLNVSLWRASRFVRDNITVQSYRGA